MDFKEKISKENYLALKNEIKYCSAVGSAIRKAADCNKGIVRAKLRDKKRFEGRTARLNYLALAVLKGRKHADVEPMADARYVPDADDIKAVLRFLVLPAYSKVLDQELRTFFEPPEQEIALAV